jgi:hypothetical protein
MGNQGFAWINKRLTELLTGSIAKNAAYHKKNTYSKILNVADFKACKQRLLAVKYVILIIYKYPTAKTNALYISTDRPAGRLVHNPPNSDRLGVYHGTASKLMVRVY